MLKMLEKLINEHGSSAILRERLKLFSDQYSALEKENSDLKTKISVLEKCNKKLESQLDQAKQEIQRLNEVINTLAKKEDSTDKLNEIQSQILQYFFKANSGMTVDHIASTFSIEIGNSQYHLDALINKKLIATSSSTIGNVWSDVPTPSCTHYAITQSGRKYVIEVLGT